MKSFFKQKSQSGQAAISAVVFFVALMLAITYGFSSLAFQVQKIVRTNVNGKKSFFVSEAGQEDVVYRLMTGKTADAQEVLAFGGFTATTTTVTTGSDRTVTSEGDALKNVRSIQTELTTSTGVSFNYGLQAGDGGVYLENNSVVSGNLSSNGPVTGDNNNIVRGAVISGGPSGLINNIHSTSTAYAHTVQNSLIEGDAYYQVISGTTVLGTSYPGSADQATSTLPISDQQIEDWKTEAESGGTITTPCPYVITSSVSIGPKKINCDLEISSDPTVTLTGAIWVNGNINIKNSAIVRVSPSLGAKSVPVIADKPSAPTTSGTITLENNTIYQGSGSTGSYILFVSQNKSSEQGGSTVAIDLKNSVLGALLVYAGHGEILIQNNIQLKEVTAYKVHGKNNAEISYESGLANLLFTSGPSGSYEIIRWNEIE